MMFRKITEDNLPKHGGGVVFKRDDIYDLFYYSSESELWESDYIDCQDDYIIKKYTHRLDLSEVDTE